jgi:AcrR family transcriptional regulator
MTAATSATAATATPDRDARLQAVLRRLADSRGALRQAMMPPPEPAPGSGGGGLGGLGGLSDPLRRLWRRLRRATRRSPVAVLLGDAVRGWWRRHPWRPTGTLLLGQVQPLVQGHPVASVAVAAVAGAALVGLRPWRWRAVDTRLRPVPGRMLRWLLAELSSAPMQTALAGLALMALRSDGLDGPATAATGPAGMPGGPTAEQAAREGA